MCGQRLTCSMIPRVTMWSNCHAITHPVLPAPKNKLPNSHRCDVAHAPSSAILALFTKPSFVLRAPSNLSAEKWDTSFLSARFLRAPPMFNAVACFIISASMAESWEADAAFLPLPEPLAFFAEDADSSEFGAGAL